MTQELTDWFPGSVLPVREGVYQTGEATYAYFDDTAGGWTPDCCSPAEAFTEALFGSAMRKTVDQWRGLAKCPEPDLFA